MRAHADPIAYRLRLPQREALRLRGALELLDRVSDWRRHLPRGHAAGIACVEYEGTAVALALDVTLEKPAPQRGTSPQPWRSALATPNNGKHHAWRPRLNFQPQEFLDPVPQLVEHRHRKPVRLSGSTSIL